MFTKINTLKLTSFILFVCLAIGQTAAQCSSNCNGFENTFFGNGAGLYNTSSNNAFFGAQAGRNNEGGGGNSIFGSQAGINNVSGSGNSIYGNIAGEGNTSGDNNCYFGQKAARANNNSGNCFFGYSAGETNTGSFNCFFGYEAGKAGGPSQIFGSYNCFYGYQAGKHTYLGNANCFFGHRAGYKNKNGAHNTYIGEDAGQKNVDGSYNSYLGENTAKEAVSGSRNCYIGYSAGLNNDGGSGNVNLGYMSGVHVTGNKNVMIGFASGPESSTAMSHRLFINDTASATPLIYGEFDNDLVVINGNFEALGIDNASSRALKENFTEINNENILEKIDALPVVKWNYISQPNTTHIGPIAEDFHDLFQLDADNTKISTIDIGGISLAGIKALYKENEELKTQLKNQQAQIQTLINRLDQLEK